MLHDQSKKELIWKHWNVTVGVYYDTSQWFKAKRDMGKKPSMLNWRLLSWYYSYSRTIDFIWKIKLFKNVLRMKPYSMTNGLQKLSSWVLSKLFTWCGDGLFWWAEPESCALIWLHYYAYEHGSEILTRSTKGNCVKRSLINSPFKESWRMFYSTALSFKNIWPEFPQELVFTGRLFRLQSLAVTLPTSLSPNPF